jgi:hypothetical protein
MSSGMSSTPRSTIPPPVDDPERTAARAASFEDTLDDTIDQSFPASDPPSTNPAPSYTSEASAPQASGAGWFSDSHMHLRHEGLVWAAAGALGAVASMRLLGSRRSSRLIWQLAPAAAVLAGAAFAFAQQFADRDPAEGC